MATETLDLAQEGVSFLLTANDIEKPELSEISISADKLVKDVKDFIELRADIFLQKEEKIQQFQQDQLCKLESEEQSYVNKLKEIEVGVSNCAKQLREVEHSYFDIKKKLGREEELNIKLKDEMSNLAIEKDDLKEKYLKTHSLYSNVIQWYEDYLNVNIHINKECPMEITFYYGKEKRKSAPYINFEVTDDFTFRILDVHADLKDDKENFQEFFTTQEVISYIYGSLKKLKMTS